MSKFEANGRLDGLAMCADDPDEAGFWLPEDPPYPEMLRYGVPSFQSAEFDGF